MSWAIFYVLLYVLAYRAYSLHTSCTKFSFLRPDFARGRISATGRLFSFEPKKANGLLNIDNYNFNLEQSRMKLSQLTPKQRSDLKSIVRELRFGSTVNLEVKVP